MRIDSPLDLLRRGGLVFLIRSGGPDVYDRLAPYGVGAIIRGILSLALLAAVRLRQSGCASGDQVTDAYGGSCQRMTIPRLHLLSACPWTPPARSMIS
eukprot:scaffold1465_cov383-Prasinococcus_capsulatus_cf.AAC.9